MTKYPIVEKFSWLIPDFKATEGTGNKLMIKGKALFSGVVSKNSRKYVHEELMKAARTLVGKPLTINHDMKRAAGNVTFAECEDETIEYVAEVNDKSAAGRDSLQKFKTEGPQHYSGVSVEADYLYNRCPDCGKRFGESDQKEQLKAFDKHMRVEHQKITELTQPFGIVFKALSLVESPEVPGVAGTTIELLETAGDMSRLLETVTKEIQEKMTKEEIKTEKKAETKTDPLKETKPIEEKKTESIKEAEKPIKAIVTADKPIAEAKPEPKNPYGLLKEFKTVMKLPIIKEKLSLGEPFAGYTDFADCVAKNSDKDNPEAYCGSIKHEVEGETVHNNRVAEIMNTIHENMLSLREGLVGVVDVLTMTTGDMAAAKLGITEDMKKLRSELGEFAQTVAALPTDDKSWKESLAKLEEQFKVFDEKVKALEMLPHDDKWTEPITKLQEQAETLDEKVTGWKKDTETILSAVDKRVDEKAKTLEERMKEIDDLKTQLNKKDEKTVKETESLTVRVDNLEAKQGKGKFKEQAPNLKPERPIIVKDPYERKN